MVNSATCANREIRCGALAGVHRRYVPVSSMIAMHVADQNDIDVPETWIIWPSCGPAGVG
jgi:hypothetical protein